MAEDAPFNAAKMIDFYRLLQTWEKFSSRLSADDRYKSGIEVCTEQLRETVDRWVADHGV